MEKRLPWQGQTIVLSSTLSTRHPWWVQTAVNALKSPLVGWVTTILSALTPVPPPTVTPPAGGGPPVEPPAPADGSSVDPPLAAAEEPLHPPHAARSGRATPET